MPFEFKLRDPSAPSPDYLSDFNPTTVLQDPRFLDDLRAEFEERGERFASDDELVRAFYKDRAWRNTNTLSMARDLYRANTRDDARAARLARIQRVWQMLPNRPFLEALPDYVAPAVLDPINLVGGGAGVKAGAAALRGGASTLRAAGAAARAGAISEGALNAGIAAGQDALMQSRNIELGLQDEVSQTQMLGNAAIGAVIGGTLGGVIGGATVPVGAAKKQAEREIAALAARGYTPDQIATMPPREVVQALKEDLATAKARLEKAKKSKAPATVVQQYQQEVSAISDAIEAKNAEVAEDLQRRREEAMAAEGSTEQLDNLSSDPNAKTTEYESGPQARRAAMADESPPPAAAATPAPEAPSDPNAPAAGANEAAPSDPSAPDAAAAQPTAAAVPDAAAPRLSPAAAALVQASGVDVAQLAPNANGTVTKAIVEEHLAQKAAGEAFDKATAEPAVSEPAKAAYEALSQTLKDLEEVVPEAKTMPRDQRAAMVRSMAESEYPNLVDEVMAVAEARDFAMRDFIDPLSEAERAAVDMKARELADRDPTITFEQARMRYLRAIVMMRGGRLTSPTGEPKAGVTPEPKDPKEQVTSSAGRAVDTLATGPTTAGRSGNKLGGFYNPREVGKEPTAGKIQAQLKQGAPTERDAAGNVTRTVLGRPPTAYSVAREAVEAVAEAEGRIVQTTAKGFERNVIGGQDIKRWKNAEGKETVVQGVEAGKPIWYSPRTDKYYASQELAIEGETGHGLDGGGNVEGRLEDVQVRDLERRKANLEEQIQVLGAKERPSDRDQRALGSARLELRSVSKQLISAKIKAKRAELKDKAANANAAVSKAADNKAPTPTAQAAGSSGDPAAAAPAPTQAGPLADIMAAVQSGDFARAQRLITEAAQAKAAGSREAAKAALEHPEVPIGYRVALRSKTDPRDVRVLDAADEAQGKDVVDLVGRDNPKDWEVGLVPGDKAWISGAPDTAAAFKTFADINVSPERPLSLDEAKGRKLTDFTLTAAERGALERAMKQHGLANSVDSLSIRDLHGLISKAEGLSWRTDAKDVVANIESLRSLYALQARVAPLGIRGDVAERKAILESLGTLFRDHDPADVEFARTLIARLAGDDAPIINVGGDRSFYSGSTNAITVRSSPANTPKGITFAHELAHWSYFNVLSPSDRLEFWDNVLKSMYRPDGTLDPQRIMDRGPAVARGANDFMRFGNAGNWYESPQELFANQFAMWATQNHGALIYRDESFWKRVTMYLQSVFDRFMDRKAIDPALEKHFLKILPDEAKPAKNLPSKPPSEAGRAILEIYSTAHIYHDDLMKAIDADSPELIVEAAIDLANHMRRGSPRKSRKMVNSRVREIMEAIGAGDDYANVMKSGRTGGDGNVEGTGDADEDAIADFFGGLKGAVRDDAAAAERINELMLPKNPGDYRSIQYTYEVFLRNLEKQFSRVADAQQKANPDDIEFPGMATAFRDLVAKTKSERDANMNAQIDRKRAQRIEILKSQLMKVEAAAAQAAKEMPKRTDLKPAPAGPDIKSLTPKQLYDEVLANKGNERGQAALNRVIEVVKARPLPAEKVKTTRAIVGARADDLRTMLVAAFEAKDKTAIDQITYEFQRRHHNKHLPDGMKPVTPVFSLTDRALIDALDREIHDYGASYDGIPENAPAVVREVLSYMTHRDPELQLGLRTMTYRMLNLLGRTQRDALGQAQVMSMGDLSRLLGQPQEPGAAGAFIDLSHPQFSALRADLRRATVALNRGPSTPIDAVHEVGHLLVRAGLLGDEDAIVAGFDAADDAVKAKVLDKYGAKYGHLPDAAQQRAVAEEWFVESFAQYLGERVAKNDMWALRDGAAPELRGRLGQLVDRLIEFVAYVTNGLIGRNDVKQQFRRLFLFGDLPSARATELRPLDATGVGGWAVASSVGPDYARQVWNGLSDAQRAKLTEFVRGTPFEVADGEMPPVFFHGTPDISAFKAKDVIFETSKDGQVGPGIYMTLSPSASDRYATNPTGSAKARLIDGVDPQYREEAEELVAAWHSAQHALGDTARALYKAEKAAQSTGNEVLDTINAVPKKQREELMRHIASLGAEIEAKTARLQEIGANYNPGVLPAYISPRNPLDLSKPLSPELLQELSFRIGIPEERLLPLAGSPGSALYDALEDAFDNVPEELRRTEINRYLGEMGYDAIRVPHVNTLDSGQRLKHDTWVLIDHVGPDGQPVKASQLVKHVKAAEYDRDDPRLRYSLLNGQVPNAGTVAQAVAEGADPREPRAVAGVLDALDRAGVPGSVTNLVGNLLRGRRVTGKEVSGTRRFFTSLLGENAQRLEQGKLHWLGQWTRQHFADHHQATAAKLFGAGDRPAILTLLSKLPDAPGDLNRWFKNARAFTRPPAQPASHARIVSALRRGDTSALSEAETEAANAIRGALSRELAEMRDAGMWVGSIENYFPQVWRSDLIERDLDGFVAKMADYFQAEARDRGETMIREDAVERARRMAANIGDEDEYVSRPPVGAQRQATSENLDFQRLIRLEKPQFREHLDALESYLENDLEGTLVKYFDATTRRMLQTKQFGLLNHGAYDYLHVAADGVNGIAQLLANNRVFRRSMKSVQSGGEVVDSTLSDTIAMPFDGDEVAAKNFAFELQRIHREGGDAAARQAMKDAVPGYYDGLNRNDRLTFDRRVDAITAALRDFGGETRQVRAEDVEFAKKLLQVAMRKPVDAGALMNGNMARDISAGLRTFNSVTLLGFTTLASLGDTVMPLLRGGDFTSYVTALNKFRADPDYRRSFERLGVTMDSLVHEKMAGLFQYDERGRLNQFSNAFFNATGLTPWTNLTRKMAAATGFEMFKVDVEKAIRLQVGDGLDIAVQRPEYKRIMRRLNKYGLGDYVLQNRQLPDWREDFDPTLRTALMRFTNDTVFAPTPNDIPLWAQTPVGAIVFQLKAFPLMMSRLAKDVLVDDTMLFVKTGDPAYLKRPGFFLTFGPAMGAAALAANDLARQRGGEENDQAALQNRNVMKLLGYEREIHGDESTFLGWYFGAMLQMGGLGLIAETMLNTAMQVDNGAYGTQRIMSLFLGPSVGTLQSTVNVLGGAKDAALDSTPESNAKERTAVREAIQRVPVLGGMGSVRNAVTDAVAGEVGEAEE